MSATLQGREFRVAQGEANRMESIRIGSESHKQLFCQTFIQTHDPFKPEEIAWPDLDDESLARLKSLPVWNEAARTEAATAVKVQALGRTEPDPVLAEAIALQGYEEARHADVIQRLTGRYDIAVKPFPEPEVPKDPTWAFLRTGYGECLDSFFAFGLFALGGRSGLFPPKIISIFETISCRRRRGTSSSSSTGRRTCGRSAPCRCARLSTRAGPGTSWRRQWTAFAERCRWAAPLAATPSTASR